MANSKETVIEFIDNLQREFGDNIDRKTAYQLVSKGLVRPKDVRNFNIIKDFNRFLEENNGHVTESIYDVSNKYEISERQAYNIIYTRQSRGYFRTSKNIKE